MRQPGQKRPSWRETWDSPVLFTELANPPICIQRWVQCTENSIYIFPEMTLRGLVPDSYIPVSVSNLYISMIRLPIWLQQNRQFHFWEYIKQNQTFILDSHRPFTCIVDTGQSLANDRGDKCYEVLRKDFWN